MDSIFISDLHLRSLNERNGQILLRFFHEFETQAKPIRLFLLGDIFDLWVGTHDVFVERYLPLLESLIRLKKLGSQIFYFEGNHDLHLQKYWETEIGAEVFTEAKNFQIEGMTVRCEHGDQMNPADLGYLRLRSFLRHPVTGGVLKKLPGIFVDFVGNKWSQQSRKKSSSNIREENIRKVIRAHAQRICENEKIDLLVSGHMHVQDDWIFSTRF